MKPLAFTTALAAALLASGAALASPDYPSSINGHLGTSCPAMACTLCHATAGGSGVPVTEFGKAMVAAGLHVNNDGDASLNAALDTLAKDNTCAVDGGPGFIDTLKACGDPNTLACGTAGGGGNAAALDYGCSAARAQDASGGLVTLLAAALGVVVTKKLRKRPA